MEIINELIHSYFPMDVFDQTTQLSMNIHLFNQLWCFHDQLLQSLPKKRNIQNNELFQIKWLIWKLFVFHWLWHLDKLCLADGNHNGFQELGLDHRLHDEVLQLLLRHLMDVDLADRGGRQQVLLHLLRQQKTQGSYHSASTNHHWRQHPTITLAVWPLKK